MQIGTRVRFRERALRAARETSARFFTIRPTRRSGDRTSKLRTATTTVAFIETARVTRNLNGLAFNVRTEMSSRCERYERKKESSWPTNREFELVFTHEARNSKREIPSLRLYTQISWYLSEHHVFSRFLAFPHTRFRDSSLYCLATKFLKSFSGQIRRDITWTNVERSKSRRYTVVRLQNLFHVTRDVLAISSPSYLTWNHLWMSLRRKLRL